MGDMSKNLSRHEMACQCGCGFDTVDIELVTVIQDCCDQFSDKTDHRVILQVTGPNRCPDHNAAVGGAKNSQHQYGRAMDFKLFADGVQIDPKEVYDYLDGKYQDKYGIGLYHNRVHFDTRTNGPARWNENAR